MVCFEVANEHSSKNYTPACFAMFLESLEFLLKSAFMHGYGINVLEMPLLVILAEVIRAEISRLLL